jgi:putative N-acetylmannosamine-6-phosphate epimerase
MEVDDMTEKSRMMKILEESHFSLLVSIPRNDPEMAKAAEEGGADGIKVHLNVSHYASGTDFGPWESEKKNITAILENAKIPVGLLPGADKVASKDEIKEARKMGIDFLDSFAHQMPLYLWKLDGLGMMLAVNSEYSWRQVEALEHSGMDALEATVLPHEEYGKDLNMRDVSIYRNLAISTTRPLIIPTQKKIRPEEAAILKKAGARGIVIGAVVTGKTAEGVFTMTKAFREAIDNIKK